MSSCFFSASWRCRRPSWPYRCVTLRGFSLGRAPGSTPVVLSSPNARPPLPKKRTGISFAVIPFSLARVSPRQAPSVSLPRGNGFLFFSSCKSRGFSHLVPGRGLLSSALTLTLTFSHPRHRLHFSQLKTRAARVMMPPFFFSRGELSYDSRLSIIASPFSISP